MLLFAVVTVAYVPLAAAHDTCSSHPSDPSFVCLRDNHSRYEVCDRHSDGHRAMVRVTRASWATVNFYDSNGAAAGCESYNARAFPDTMSYQVCVETEGCGPRIHVDNW